MSKRRTIRPAHRSAGEPVFVCDLGAQWTNAIDVHADGLISWRNYVAIVLRDIVIEDVLGGLVPAIATMEQLTTQRILGAYAEHPDDFLQFGFYDWRPVWQDHFQHWQDPVRDMLGALCVTPDEQLFARQLHTVDGQVLLDFLLAPCSAACWLKPALRGEQGSLYPESPVSMIDSWQPGRLHEQLCQVLYRRFTEIAPFATMPVPDEVSLDLSYDRLCTEESGCASSDGNEEASPC